MILDHITIAMIKATTVSAYPNYTLLVSFGDGKEGLFDCSQLVGSGIFSKLKQEPSLFLKPRIIDNGNAIARDDQLDIDARGCYEDLLVGNYVL